MNKTKLQISGITLKSRRNDENIKSIKANIEFAENSPKTIMVTSSIPSEGKSSVSVSLAKTFAVEGKKVLLVDADIRKSKFAENLNIARKDNIGLTQVLRKEIEAKDAILETDIENLFVLLSGNFTSNPTKLLNNGLFGISLNQYKDEYDYIIIDTAPIGSVIDTALICKYSDGVVFVIGSNMVNKKIVQNSVIQLERAGANIIGCVLNKLRLSNRGLYGTYGTNKYYYSSYNDYYGGE